MSRPTHKIICRFFTRKGGVSSGLYKSLNCGPGSQDDADAVAENRRRAMAIMGLAPSRLISLKQVHSATTVFMDKPVALADRPEADALVTTTPGLALGIVTADCVPILLADETAGVIGAAHAGWKGTLSGIAGSVVDTMTAAGARRENIRAEIGPAIQQASYEVGPEILDRFRTLKGSYSQFFRPSEGRAGHFLFDLPGCISARLWAAGISRITRWPHDTYALEDQYFSYRRASHRGDADYGRHLSAIALLP